MVQEIPKTPTSGGAGAGAIETTGFRAPVCVAQPRHFRLGNRVLNSHHKQLGRAPLHFAMESDEGLLRVEALLERMTLNSTDTAS